MPIKTSAEERIEKKRKDKLEKDQACFEENFEKIFFDLKIERANSVLAFGSDLSEKSLLSLKKIKREKWKRKSNYFKFIDDPRKMVCKLVRSVDFDAALFKRVNRFCRK